MAHSRALLAATAGASLAIGWLARDLIERRTAVRANPATQMSAAAPVSSAQMQHVFDDIYRNARWGRNADDAGTSGGGSQLQTTVVYRAFLQKFLKDAEVHSVVDAGCGDWEFASAIDWTGIDYQGFDIVPSVVEHDNEKYAKANVRFFVRDIVDGDLPPADLLIAKHVLQHLPTAAVQRFLAKIPGYRHVLLVDTVDRATMSSNNPDIEAGSFRYLDVTRSPFEVHGAKLLTYWDGGNMQQVVYVAGRK
jgi:SAM-dependent methyltransferase